MINTVHNWICLTLWIAVLLKVVIPILIDNYLVEKEHSENFNSAVFIMRIVQWLALLETFYVLFGITKGGLVPTFMQFLGRIYVAVFYFSDKIPAIYTILVLIPWSIADIVRYSFYQSKGKIVTFLRYNLFIVLYPFGIFS